MNIEGFGEQIVEDFYNRGYLKRIPDFYYLYKVKQELMELEGFGEKSINNLLESIEKSKNNSLEQLLFALGIKHVGKKVAKIIASHYKNIDNIINATVEDIQAIDDIGIIIAESIKEYFNDKDNIDTINKLKDIGMNMTYVGEEIEQDENFQDKTFVLTGTLSVLTRNEATNEIEKRGGKATSSVTKKTNYVIVGENPGSKYDKAKELNINILTEEEFLKLINFSK